LTTLAAVPPIRGARLDLVSMSPAFLEASLARDLARCAELLGASVPAEWNAPGLLRLRLRQLRADPSLQEWLLRALVLRTEARMVGFAGFHAPPGLPHLPPGAVELGYTVFRDDRRQGYAREATLALMDWAQRERGVAHFVASIGPTNEPSLGLARQLGFTKIGEQVDPEDGPEDVFALRRA
jgi:RimJ/RimL family protein N-acetyltransferase